MLLKKDLLNSMDSLYHPMLETVSIPDFTKCIAQFAGMAITEVPDEVIRNYLVSWATNKYKFFKLLGNKTKLDMPITYTNINDNSYGQMKELSIEFPGFAPWLDGFANMPKNKIDSIMNLGYDARTWINELFPNYTIIGNTVTGFFKRKLNAPEELVTALGRIYENETITGTYTISIDPVDMMLASENPYKWQSCYRLETPNDASHADGCLAATLDTSSLITYIWDKEGKFNLYNHELKSVRYKRIREWISIEPNHMSAIHFNQIYPGKATYPQEFRKQLRDMVETLVANYLEVDNMWVKDTMCDCYRDFCYGYGEFDSDNIWRLKAADSCNWYVYDTHVACPCGCGNGFPCSDNDDEYCYNGDGFVCYNFSDEDDKPWCSIAEDYCCYADDICDGNCRGCSAYDDEYPMCDLDDSTECENVDRDLVDNGQMHSCEGHCEGCALWAAHHPTEVTLTEENTSSEPYEEFKSVLDEVHTLSVPLTQTITISNNNQIGFWTFNPIENTTAYTISQEDMINMTFPDLPTHTYFKEEVTMDQIRDAVEQASPLNVMDITNEMIREARDRAIENETYQSEIIFGKPRKEE